MKSLFQKLRVERVKRNFISAACICLHFLSSDSVVAVFITCPLQVNGYTFRQLCQISLPPENEATQNRIYHLEKTTFQKGSGM